MSVDFAEEFARSKGPIQWEGRTIQPYLTVDVKRGDRIEISFLRYTRSPVQGISILSDDRSCEIEINSVRSRGLTLWTDTAPEHLNAVVRRPVRREAQVRIRNVWRDEKYGTLMYGLNAAAMELIEQPDGTLLARCSDGWLGPDFEDLVALLRIVKDR